MNTKHYLLILLLGLIARAAGAQTRLPAEAVSHALATYDYEQVLSLTTPACGDSLLAAGRAQALKALGRPAEAAREWDALLGPDSTRTAVLAELAECYKAAGNAARAAACYRRALDACPDNRYFRLQHIRLLLAQDDYEGARTACHGWLERDTVSATGYKYLGQAYEGMKDWREAFLAYNMAYRRDSLDAQTVARIAALFNSNEQYADAVALTEDYRRTDTTSIDVNRQNAKAYCMLRDYPAAIARYEALKGMGDRSFLTLYYLGVSHYGDNWFYGAHDNLLEAYNKNPTDINVLYYLAKACSRTSWKKEGVEYMESALEAALPGDSLMARLYAGLADCYGRAGKTYEKIDAQQKLYRLNKDYKLLYDIARAYDWKKDYENAVHYYEKYMALVPKNLRVVLDEDGNPLPDAETLYQVAERRTKKIRAEDFFRNGVPDEEFDFKARLRKVTQQRDTTVVKQ